RYVQDKVWKLEKPRQRNQEKGKGKGRQSFQGTRMEEVPLMFSAVKAMFYVALKAFYNTVEVSGRDKLPKPGQCSIICPNHGNSLCDAIVVVSQTPRMVQLTAKDSLWSHPFFSIFVKGTGTLPIQRRAEHGSSADNTSSFSKIYEALGEGRCVAMFPEGISRYQSGIAKLKRGIGLIALEVLKRKSEAGEDFTVNICSCAITYLHREKFRSDVGVTYDIAIQLTTDNYKKLIDECRDEQGAAAKIMDDVGEQLRKNAISALDWETLAAGDMARRIYAPVGTRISLHQTVSLTQGFVKVLSQMSEAQAQSLQNGVRTASDPDLKALLAAKRVTNNEAKELDELKQQLLAYSQGLQRIGLPDHRITLEANVFSLCIRAVIRSFHCLLLLCLAVPGTILLAPLLLAGKVLEWRLQSHNQTERDIRNMDEVVTQYKLGAMVCFGPILALLGSWLMTCYGISPWRAPVLALLWLWMTVRWLEDGIASARSLTCLFRLLLHPNKVKAMKLQREALVPKVASLADRYGLPEVGQLIREAPSIYREPSKLKYFSLKRRRKREWGEVLRSG
ncbi:unnamed protein product, partial [Chrysoparadoxa australica]